MASAKCRDCSRGLQPSGVGLLACPGCRATFVGASAAAVTLLTAGTGPAERAVPLLELDPEFRTQFALGRVLGRGAMGMVCEGESPRHGRVAVKLLLKPESGELMRRFRLEGELLERLVHPNVIAVHEVGDVRGNPYLAMELLPGGTFRERLNVHKKLPVARAVEIFGDLLDGLHACHVAGVVHRDLKPENVLFTADGVPKLADFGIAKSFECGMRATQAGAVIGTPLYMAPEQLRGESVCVASDLYAVGLMLYETLTGALPVKFSTLAELIQERLTKDVPPLPPSVPPAVAEWVHRALRRPIAERPQSAADLATGLRNALAGHGARSRSVPAPRPPPGFRGIPVLMHLDARFYGLLPMTFGFFAFFWIVLMSGAPYNLLPDQYRPRFVLALFVFSFVSCAMSYPYSNRKP